MHFLEKNLNIVTEFCFYDVKGGFSEKIKTVKVCKHARVWVLRDREWTGKIENHVLIDFLIFKFLLTCNLDTLAKSTKS